MDHQPIDVRGPEPMTPFYVFAAAAGIPLLAWFLFSGGADDGPDGAGGDDGIGGIMLRLLPLSTVAIAMATFGVCGLALGLAGASSGATLLAAVLTGLGAGALNSAVFTFLRRSESSADVSDERLAGAIGRVVLPIVGGRRGRVAVSTGGQQVYLSAQAVLTSSGEPSDDLEVGAPVLVVEARNGVAMVARLDPELSP